MDIESKPKLLRYIKSIEETPQWLVDNLHLKRGYRIGYTSIRSNIAGLFHRHNDVMNIWTHLLGALFFLVFLVGLVIASLMSVSLYSEIQHDVSELNIGGRIQASYQTNIVPVVAAIKRYGNSMDIAKLARLRYQLENRISQAEKEYTKVINHAIQKFKNQEVTFLKSFNIEYERAIRNIKQMELNFIQRLNDLQLLTAVTIKTVARSVENYFNTDNFVKRFSTAVQLDLEVYPIAVFAICAILCLGASAVFHTFYVMSPRANQILQRIDMAGINILIFGSVFAMMYYFFYCSPLAMGIYTCLSFVSCFGVFVISMGDKIHTIKYVKLKGFMFGTLGVSNAAPLIHLYFLAVNGDSDNIPLNNVFGWLLVMGGLYLTGLIFYIFRIPERFCPHRFDIWFNSHVIWHLFVFAAACTNLYSVMLLYNVRKSMPCKASL